MSFASAVSPEILYYTGVLDCENNNKNKMVNDVPGMGECLLAVVSLVGITAHEMRDEVLR